MEQDLGFCFHWIEKQDWETGISKAEEWVGTNYCLRIMTLLAKYFQDSHLNSLYRFIGGQKISNAERVTNQTINDSRCKLGERVLNELPKHTPDTTNDYRIPIDGNIIIKLLLRSPIAVAESIKGISEKSIWEDNEFVSNLRRNIQYAQYVAPDLYTKVLYHCLS